MEEEPVENVPETDVTNDFIISGSSSDEHIPESEKHENVFKEEVFTEQQSAMAERYETIMEKAETADADHEDEFNLNHISAKAQSSEEIIAAAEAAAFSDT